MSRADRILFSEKDIAARVDELARKLADLPVKPTLAVPVLMGAFVFAADLMRALSRQGLRLETEFVWLRSYGRDDRPGDVRVLREPGESVRGAHVLLLDGVLESGATLSRAHMLLKKAGAASIVSAVAVQKTHSNPAISADHCCFFAGTEFLYGYGMDASGQARGLPDIWMRET